jgi:hypothetical protein
MLDFPYSKFLTLSSYFLVSEKVQESLNRKKGTLWIELNYSLLSSAIHCNILEMADVETPNNRATPANDISDSFPR